MFLKIHNDICYSKAAYCQILLQIVIVAKKSLKIQQNGRWTDNTMLKERSAKGETTIYKTLHKN